MTKTEEEAFVTDVVIAAGMREDMAVPREFIIKALRRVQEGKEEIPRYSFGRPSMKAVYDIAVQLHAATMPKN
jgi:hypothetical protein